MYPKIEHIHEDGADGIVVGTGQHGVAHLSDSAYDFLKQNRCEVIIAPTPDAITHWNKAAGKWIGLFHVTC